MYRKCKSKVPTFLVEIFTRKMAATETDSNFALFGAVWTGLAMRQYGESWQHAIIK